MKTKAPLPGRYQLETAADKQRFNFLYYRLSPAYISQTLFNRLTTRAVYIIDDNGNKVRVKAESEDDILIEFDLVYGTQYTNCDISVRVVDYEKGATKLEKRVARKDLIFAQDFTKPTTGIYKRGRRRYKVRKVKRTLLDPTLYTKEIKLMSQVVTEPKEDAEIRICLVHSWILNGLERRAITRRAREQWSVSENTAIRYYNEAKQLIRDRAVELTELGLEWHISRRLQLIEDMIEAQDYRGALDASRDIAKLQHLYAADKAALAKAGLDEKAANRAESIGDTIKSLLQDIAPSSQDD